MTTGAKTGRLLAAMVNRERPEIDVSPYTPARFAA
jgi:glycine/D-amino acid oxidase-like deaminating enzyme